MNPTVSVIMSVYNGEPYLHEAIESIINQTFTDFEFIIINDGSTDSSGEIITDYKEKDSRIYMVDQGNTGLTKALNKAIKMAKGKYLARQDADDISKENRLEIQYNYLEQHKNIVLLGTGAYLIDENGEIFYKYNVIEGSEKLKKKLNNNNQFIHGSIMVRSSVMKKIGWYNENFRKAQDYELFLRISKNYLVNNLNTPLYKLRIWSQSISESDAFDQQLMGYIARYLNSENSSLTQKEFKNIEKRYRSELYLKNKIKITVNLAKAERLKLKGDYKGYFKIIFNNFKKFPSIKNFIHFIMFFYNLIYYKLVGYDI
jgi:glycosyltransferase involved in cell wall biosynthesis